MMPWCVIKANCELGQRQGKQGWKGERHTQHPHRTACDGCCCHEARRECLRQMLCTQRKEHKLTSRRLARRNPKVVEPPVTGMTSGFSARGTHSSAKHPPTLNMPHSVVVQCPTQQNLSVPFSLSSAAETAAVAPPACIISWLARSHQQNNQPHTRLPQSTPSC